MCVRVGLRHREKHRIKRESHGRERENKHQRPKNDKKERGRRCDGDRARARKSATRHTPPSHLIEGHAILGVMRLILEHTDLLIHAVEHGRLVLPTSD